MTHEQIQLRVSELGQWFHNMNLGGVQTAPQHFLGDYPALKWRAFEHAIPADLSGKAVLDIGCNAGFFSMQMKRRGASRVLAIDSDPAYLDQARFAAQINEAEIEFRQMDVYDVPSLRERFDIVLFTGVLYHLRYPLLALDLIHDRCAKDMLVFQSLLRGSDEIPPIEPDYPFSETEVFNRPGYPVLHFVEGRYSHDPTNWWIPNRACAEAMLRTAGFEIGSNPAEDIYICHRSERD